MTLNMIRTLPGLDQLQPPQPAPESPRLELTAHEREILEEARRAMRALPPGTVGGTTEIEIRDSLARAIQSEAFARFRQLVDEHRAAPKEAVGFDLKSVTFGIEFELALLIGAEGSFGVAVPPGNWFDVEEYVMYLTAGVVVGPIADELGGLVIGLYNVQPTDLAGGAYSLGVDIGLGDDVAVEASWANINLTGFLGISIADGEGGGGGGDIEYSYTYVIGWHAPVAFQEPGANYMLLNEIDCNTASEKDHDEVYFTFTPDNTNVTYRYPTHGQYSMADGQTWQVGRSINFNNQVVVQLWDDDDTSNDDSLGSTTYTVSNFSTSVTVSGSGGNYTLKAVLNQAPPAFAPGKRINTIDFSPNGPYGCVFNGKSYVLWGGGNAGVYYSASADGTTWPNGARINTVDTTPSTPSAVQYGDQLFVFWMGSSNPGVYWSASDDGVTWPAGSGIAGESCSTPPVPCVFNGTLYLFWTLNDSSRRIVFSTFNASTRTWSAHQPINGSDSSAKPVAPVVFNNQIYLFFCAGTSTPLNYTSSSTNSWPVSKPAGTEWSKAAPFACVANGKLYVFFTSTNNATNVRYMVSTDGRTFPPSLISSGTTVTNGSAAACVSGGRITLLYCNLSQWVCFTNGNP